MSVDSANTLARRLDDSARAGWLYYVAGYRQEEIARSLGVSRQTAQRLVAMSTREKLIRIRLEHPIMRCMELAETLSGVFGLQQCEVVPSEPSDQRAATGLAHACAAAMEREMSGKNGRICAVGTGRSLRAGVEELASMNRPDHTVVALVGHMMSGGLSTRHDVATRLADRINAQHYPMPLPIYCGDPDERDLYRSLDAVEKLHRLADRADVTFVGIGGLGPSAPLVADGVVSEAECQTFVEAGAVGEITGWLFDGSGRLLEGLANDRVNSVPPKPCSDRPVYAVAAGAERIDAIRGAMVGGLINRLITNEATAERLVA